MEKEEERVRGKKKTIKRKKNIWKQLKGEGSKKNVKRKGKKNNNNNKKNKKNGYVDDNH